MKYRVCTNVFQESGLQCCSNDPPSSVSVLHSALSTVSINFVVTKIKSSNGQKTIIKKKFNTSYGHTKCFLAKKLNIFCLVTGLNFTTNITFCYRDQNVVLHLEYHTKSFSIVLLTLAMKNNYYSDHSFLAH